MNKICTTDEDCDNNSLCAFDETNMENYCVDNSIDKLYYGCLNEGSNYYESVESKTPQHKKNYIDCINFSRKQINDEEMNYNYMIYRPKTKIFVDLTTINIYLKVNNQIVAVIPYQDYFNLTCDKNSENCILKSKESIYNFIKQNTMDIFKRGSPPSQSNITLEIIYMCENEGLKKTETINIDLNNQPPIIINMNCPIDKNNKELLGKCEALYVNDSNYDNFYKSIDNKIHQNNCLNPLFKVPITVSDKSKYKKIKNKKMYNEMKYYDEMINEKVKDVNKLEAKRYIRLKKLLYNENIEFDDALKIVSSSNKPSTQNNKWKIFNNYDAAQKLFSFNDNQVEILKYYGKVYTIQDAMDAANKNNELFFVWYHNSYELDNYASKLFFIDIFSIDENIINKKEWVKSDNVSTGVLNFNMENFDSGGYGTEFPADPFMFGNDLYDIDHTDYIEGGNIIGNDMYNANYNNLNKLQTALDNINGNDEDKADIQTAMYDYILNTETLNDNIINNLNNKMTTYEQSISMNNYESDINDNILFYLKIILFVLIIILISVLGYYNYYTANTM